MKNPGNTAKLLDLPFAPEAEQMRVGLEAEADDENSEAATSNDYSWGRGSGSVVIQDWWTANSVALRLGPGVGHQDIALARIQDSLMIRTTDGLDRVVLEGYLGLIPDASTLRIIFNDGSEWAGDGLIARIASHIVRQAEPPAGDAH